MTDPTSSEKAPQRLAARDYFILPLLSLATIFMMFVTAEVVSRITFAEHEENACVVVDDIHGFQVKPNCTARAKAAEAPWTTYHFNECGYRSETSCGPKPPGSVRIAIVGASVSQALHVPYEKTYFAQASQELSRLCATTVDVQNLGRPKANPIDAYRHIDEVLALKPDVVLYLLSPFDLEQQMDPQELANRNNPARPLAVNAVHEPMSLMRRLQLLLVSSRTVVVAEHFLLQDKETFLRLYLNYGDKADFLRQPFTPAWQKRFADIALIIGDMSGKLRTAGVPLIVIPVPSRAEAALLSSLKRPPSVDPFAFGHRLESIATEQGAGFVDLMQPFAQVPNAENLFLVVDGHVAVGGQRVIAQRLVEKLTDGTVPAFSQCARPAKISAGSTAATGVVLQNAL